MFRSSSQADPRISADPCNLAAPYRGLAEEEQHSFIRFDDPEHQRVRSLAMRPFGPPRSPGRIDAMRGEIAWITEELIEAFHGRTRIGCKRP